jgi:pimeloyl-ACP methyl ester carboxylesterase
MSHAISTDGTPIGYERSGAGPALVMMHGAGTNHQAWGPVLQLLAEHFTVYAMDQRGRGESGPYTDACKPEQAFADIASVIDAVGEPVYLLGHSMGARNALHAALLTPNVRKMALYEPPPFDPIAPAQLQRMRDALARDDRDEVVTIFLVEQTRIDPQALAAIRQRPTWSLFTSNAANLVTELASFDSYHFDASDFANLRVPTLVLLGGDSPAFMKQEAELINAALPDSRIQVLGGQGHTAFRIIPQQFADIVTSFFLG